MTRDIAVKFNITYCKDFDPQTGEGGVLRIPDPYIMDSTAVIPGLDGEKMSKSYGNTIPIFDTPKKIRKRIMSIVTDSTSSRTRKTPIHALFTPYSNSSVRKRNWRNNERTT